MSIFGVLLLFSLHNTPGSVDVGNSCTTKDGQRGTCLLIKDCPTAIQNILKKINPQICGFIGLDPIVCCASVTSLTALNNNSAPATTVSTTASTQSSGNDFQCDPLPDSVKGPTIDNKAWTKCQEYQEKYLFPCEKSVADPPPLQRMNYCGHNSEELIIRGTEANPGEYPHMALLGYGALVDSAEWLCEGSIISEWFIVTVGHCTRSRDYDDVSFARIGVYKKSDKIDKNNVYKVGNIIIHPEFKPPKKYNDIALIKTEKQMKLSNRMMPACLHTGDTVNDDKAYVTGWGSTTLRGNLSDTMLRVPVIKSTEEECSQAYPPKRTLDRGLNYTTQACYGPPAPDIDVCGGFSGGQLQIKNQKIQCMYTIIGIMSFGVRCGFAVPMVYTRIAPYSAWITNIVWNE